MYILFILTIIVAALIVLAILEYTFHQKRVFSIPVRIHINGTRGKSSVTRLIGGGLREGGIASITKVTGTYPRLILEDGTETLIYRKSSANILEQLSTVKFAASRKAQALVVECMALQPQYQKITENQMIHSTIGVMTNVRLDHTDVMGYTIEEIAGSMGNSIPRKGKLFTAERIHDKYLEKICKKKKTELFISDPETVSNREMKKFRYLEHKENVALALAICEHLGVDREKALAGMYKCTPDAGALTKSTIRVFGKEIIFYNAFAANDPESTLMIWKKINDEIGFQGAVIFLLNNRQDRFERGKQLIEMLGNKLKDKFDFLVLVGDSTDVIEGLAVSNKIPRNKIVNIHARTAEVVYEKALGLTKEKSSIIAIGNMGGVGAKIAEYFEHRDTN